MEKVIIRISECILVWEEHEDINGIEWQLAGKEGKSLD